MRKTILCLGVLAVAACNADSTSPDVTVVSNISNDYELPSSPPPPPNDSGTVVSSQYGQRNLATRYFYNIPGNSGWLSFQKDQEAGVTVDKTARISYSKGVFSGTGTVKYLAGGGFVTLNLSGVSQASTFKSSDKGYYHLVLNGATYTLAGKTTPMEPVRLAMPAACSPNADRICVGS